MGRIQRALTSLVAAIPAGFLSYLLVMVFLQKADGLTTMTQVTVGGTLLVSALVTLMPFILLIFGGSKKNPEQSDAGTGSAGDEEAVDDSSGEVELADDDADVMDDDFDDSDANVVAESDDDLDAMDDFDIDDEEDEKPKKGKKKR